MAESKRKGDLGEAIVIADILKKGYKVALPIGEDWRFDIVVFRDNLLEKVQCKYTKSNGEVISVKTRSTNNWSTIKYTSKDVDWIAVYDETTDCCYYINSKEFEYGRSEISLRIKPAKNNQNKNVRLAKDYLKF